MTIQARYSGVCPKCGERWQPGDLIRSDYKVPGRYPIWTHAVCPDAAIDALMARARTGEVSYSECFLIHPEGACDL